jgi:DNA invertase Pin-like site-specific DNA recombinase
MVAEVCLGKVGAVAAREVSRFARNSREWQQLVEVCRVVDTVLIDQEMVYAPRLSNDRLLLGLKGSLNEYELDLLRQRSVEARLEKARRGELLQAAPVGYLKTEEQRLEKDPDLRVQQAILLVFHKFMELGTVRQTLMWFLEHGLQVPARNARGETFWKRPVYRSMHRMLTSPIYGGAYTYGKTEHLVRYDGGKPRHLCRRKPREQWLALIPGAHEGYVSWEEFERIAGTIRENTPGAGAAKNGPALLTGLLRCSRCVRKLTVRYTGSGHDVLRYSCFRGWLDNGEPRCIAFGGISVDEAIRPRGSTRGPTRSHRSVRAGESRTRPPTGRHSGRSTSRSGGCPLCSRACPTAVRCIRPGEPSRDRRVGTPLELSSTTCARDRSAYRATRRCR